MSSFPPGIFCGFSACFGVLAQQRNGRSVKHVALLRSRANRSAAIFRLAQIAVKDRRAGCDASSCAPRYQT
jgi:hypothetical protein